MKQPFFMQIHLYHRLTRAAVQLRKQKKLGSLFQKQSENDSENFVTAKKSGRCLTNRNIRNENFFVK
jgi:hypothetical protein